MLTSGKALTFCNADRLCLNPYSMWGVVLSSLVEEPLDAAHMKSIQDPLHVPAAQESHRLGIRVQGWGLH